jgi:hypothetical protein
MDIVNRWIIKPLPHGLHDGERREGELGDADAVRGQHEGGG